MFKFNQLYVIVGVSLIALFLALGWYVERTSHRATKSEYRAFGADIRAAAEIRKENDARSAASLTERLNELAEANEATLKAKDLDRQKLQRKINDEIKLNNTLNRTLNRLQDAGSGSGGVSEISTNTEGCTTTEPASDRAIDTLIEAGKSCYYDYKYLYDSWQAVCQEYGCK